MENDNPLKVYTAAEAARILKKKKQTLARWRQIGIGPEYVKEGTARQSRILYRAQALADYLTVNSSKENV